MSVHLIGGGWTAAVAPEVYGPFLAEATAHAAAQGRAVPRIVLLAIGTDDDALEYRSRFPAAMAMAGALDPVLHSVDEGAAFGAEILDYEMDGIFVAGGHTPSYLIAVQPLSDRITALVGGGVPYAGFSAGAAIAAHRAVIGGWTIDGRRVCPEDANEELDPVSVLPGIGLVDFSVDVHAAQWGTLTRLIAAVAAGHSEGGVAIDEDTVLTVGSGWQVAGSGHVWRLTPSGAGVLVTAVTAGS